MDLKEGPLTGRNVRAEEYGKGKKVVENLTKDKEAVLSGRWGTGSNFRSVFSLLGIYVHMTIISTCLLCLQLPLDR